MSSLSETIAANGHSSTTRLAESVSVVKAILSHGHTARAVVMTQPSHLLVTFDNS